MQDIGFHQNNVTPRMYGGAPAVLLWLLLEPKETLMLIFKGVFAVLIRQTCLSSYSFNSVIYRST